MSALLGELEQLLADARKGRDAEATIAALRDESARWQQLAERLGATATVRNVVEDDALELKFKIDRRLLSHARSKRDLVSSVVSEMYHLLMGHPDVRG